MHNMQSVQVQVVIFYAPVLALLGAAQLDVAVGIRSPMLYAQGASGDARSIVHGSGTCHDLIYFH